MGSLPQGWRQPMNRLSPFPKNAVALEASEGLLYTAVATDGKTHVLDAQGIRPLRYRL